MDLNKIYIVTFMMISGAILLLFGGHLPNFTIFFATTFICALVLTVSLYNYVFPSYAPEWTVWLTLYVTVGMGAGLGVGAIRWQRTSTCVICGATGAALAYGFNLLLI